MPEDILLLLIKDSFLSGIVFQSNGEYILPTLFAFSENYDTNTAIIIAFFANSLGLLTTWGAMRGAIYLIETYSLIGEELRKRNTRPNEHLFNKYFWPLLLLCPFGSGGASALLLFGLFKYPARKLIITILILNLFYYISFYFSVQKTYFATLAIITVFLIIYVFLNNKFRKNQA